MAINKKRSFKTKKILSGGKTQYRAWKEWDEGDCFVGKYLGSRQNKMNPSKEDYMFEVIEPFFTDKKEQKRLAAGEKLTLNSIAMLEKAMEHVEEGAILQITYTGSNEMEGGKYAGKMAHGVEVVEVEEDDGSSDEDSDDSDEDQDEEESNEDDEEDL